MKNLLVSACCSLLFASQLFAVSVTEFPGLDKMIEQSNFVILVRIESHELEGEEDHWGRYRGLVLSVLKGEGPKRGFIVPLRLCGAISDWPYSFLPRTTYLVFLNKDKDSMGVDEYRAPATIGAVIRVSPLTREAELKGTVRERVEQVVREGRDFCSKLHDSEQKVFRTVLGQPSLSPTPSPASSVPKH
jgi:hypothetical protein